MSNGMHAYLVTGMSPQKRQQEVNKLIENHAITKFNQLIFTPNPSHGIDSIREISRSLSIQTAPKGKFRGVVIEDAHLMTPEAQNAFLKTLEEPPGDTVLILTAPRDDLLFPTVVSRCVVIPTAPAEDLDYKEQEHLFKKLKGAGIGEKIKFTEELGKSREEAIKFIEGQLTFLHQTLHASTPDVLILKALLSAHQDLSNNVNPKMVLFELLLKFK